MTPIQITSGPYAGRILRSYRLSIDGRYVQCDIGRSIQEFALGYDCKWL